MPLTPARYAVMGNPVSHSKSPRIHAEFARQTGQDLVYEAIHVEQGGFQQAVASFFAEGGKGLNITVPFKQEAWAMATVRSADAAMAKAVNTLLLDQDGQLCGHNTDGIGLVRDILVNHGGELKGKRVLILGAGGAARGIVLPLLREAPASLVIANRTRSRAEAVVADFTAVDGLPAHAGLEACGFDGLSGRKFDWVLNATAASLHGDLPPLPKDLLAIGAWCYDLMYAAEPTVFCRWATAHGAAQSLDGLGMLVEQAAESFYLWRGLRPATQPLVTSLRTEISR